MFCKVVVITEQAYRLRPVTLAASLLSKTFVSMDSMQAMCRSFYLNEFLATPAVIHA